jgi:hypothetical protein
MTQQPDRESFRKALADRDVTLALTPAQLILLAIGAFLLVRFIRGLRG